MIDTPPYPNELIQINGSTVQSYREAENVVLLPLSQHQEVKITESLILCTSASRPSNITLFRIFQIDQTTTNQITCRAFFLFLPHNNPSVVSNDSRYPSEVHTDNQANYSTLPIYCVPSCKRKTGENKIQGENSTHK